MADYQPGVCNIGPAEQRKRSALGAIASLVTLFLVLGVLTSDVSRLVLLLSVVPLFLVAEGFLQAQAGFCAGFASAGIYDVSESGTDRQTVENATHRAADRRRAWKLHRQSAALAVGGALVVFVVGVLVP